jgi:hypothetical protein
MKNKLRRPALFAATVLVAALTAPSAQADWRGRGYGWGHGPRHYAPPARVYHYNHGYYGGAPLLGAIIGLGAGVAIGSALAAPPPVYYAPPPPVYYVPPAPPAYYAPAPVWVPAKPAW